MERLYQRKSGKIRKQGWPYCNPTTGEGWACAAWIMYKENMDYLKCADKLEWNGRTKCN